jgi:hypothetical protein
LQNLQHTTLKQSSPEQTKRSECFAPVWGEANIPGNPRKRKVKLALRVQYGALPYRFTPDAALEILLVTTRQSGAQAGRGRGTGWDDHPEEVDEAPLGDLPREGIVTLLVEVRGARPVGRLAARLNEIAGVTAVHVGDRNHASD